MEILRTTEFGNPVLRGVAKHLNLTEIKSVKVKQLILNMQHTLKSKKLGIGLAAPQVGEPLALFVICLQRTPLRPDIEPFDLVVINPKITKVFGKKTQEWEGCISGGAAKATLFAKVPRFKKVELQYNDETGTSHTEIFNGLKAHVIQHETDHLNGVLFVDKVADTKSYMTYAEYKKMKKSHKKR